MKVTKYPQSCFVVEKGPDQRLIIDPGSVALAQYKFRDFGPVHAVLYTHQHPDHFESSIVDELLGQGLPLYGNADVAQLIGPKAQQVENGVTFHAAGFEITPHDLPHCRMRDGSEGPPNTGFLIDGTFFHSGDGIELSGLTARQVALPIAGPTIDFDNAAQFARSLQAEIVIPMHYDVFTVDPHEFAKHFTDARVVVLDNGQSTEI
jgi:L-ascorbate metabolism protein UlaG (beta-lactamase superfamily)